MNSDEIVKHILEGDEDFDPIDYVKSATNRESAVEIYNGPLVRVIQPTAAFTINNYLGDSNAWDDQTFARVAQNGPLYLAVDKADHDNIAIFQPNTNKAWNGDSREQDWKSIPELISSQKPTSNWAERFDPAQDKNWLDLQQGLATYFMSQIAKKKNVGQWVKYLTMIGRTDLATNYARYLGRAKLPFGKSVDAVLAMKKAGKRSRNRIARLMKNQTNVKWGERGFWLLFDDWVDLAPFYGESRNYDYAKNAEKIFNGDTQEWFENSESKPEDTWDQISEGNMSLIEQLLVNKTVYNSEGEEHLITWDNLAELDSREIKDIVCDRGNKNDSTEDIYRAIARAGEDAYVSEMENAYYEGYRNALMKTWGLQEDKTIKWIKVGKAEPDKKLGDGTVQKGAQKQMLGIWFPYSTLEEWIGKWKEDEYEDDFYGDVHDLAAAYLEKVEPNDEYSGNSDSDYFNEQLKYHLSELEPVQPEKNVDPNQPELPMSGESDPKAKELEHTTTVQIGDRPDHKEHKGVPSEEAHKYAQAMAPTRKDIHLRAEALLATPFSRIEERAGDVKIEFTASDEGAESVVPLLKELRKMGMQGSSREITIDDWDGRNSFGFDGDGNSKIGEIKVNGQVVESLQEAQALMEAIYKRSTTQIDLPKEIGGHIIQWGELNIADEDLYIDEKDGCGRETEQHVTVLYGLTDPTPPEALMHIVGTTKPFLIEFGGVSVFENPKYDVIKLDVISEELHNLHMEIRRSCPNENKFPDYIPHCTIAYVQKGKGKKYAGQDVFKTAKVPRDFWAYDLKFKGAGDSEDANRVVQLISFDNSKPIEEPDEPEAGEQRYPEATREEPELAVAESDLKSFLARNVPMDCPECHSHNLSEPDEEGLVDCLECGIWFNPLHPANKPVAESDEVDPKQFTAKATVDPHPDWQVTDRQEDKNGRIKVLYRHKNGRVFFKLINQFFGEDTPPTPLTDWDVYVYGGADGKDFMDGEDFKAGSFDEAETTATNIAFTIVHSTAPSYFQPAPRRGRRNESDIDVKQLVARVPHHELQHWNEAGPEGGYKCSCGDWRYKLTGWSTSIGYALKEFRAHKRLMKAQEKAKLAEAEALNAKEFLNRTTNYRIRCGVGAMTKYLHQDIGTGALKWHDFDGASIFDSDKAGEMLDQIGEIYGGQPVVAELAESEIDPKAMAMRVPTDYVIKRFGDPTNAASTSYWAGEGMLFYRNINDARIMSETEANAHYKRMVQANYSPNELQVVGVQRGYTKGKASVSETLDGPFEEDGLPGEVSTFLRKVRSKRRPAKTKGQQVI